MFLVKLLQFQGKFHSDLGTDGGGTEGYTGGDTSGLFLEDGTILIEEPPGDRSYVLGFMISMWS